LYKNSFSKHFPYITSFGALCKYCGSVVFFTTNATTYVTKLIKFEHHLIVPTMFHLDPVVGEKRLPWLYTDTFYNIQMLLLSGPPGQVPNSQRRATFVRPQGMV
jgi:hypothetical protein